MVAMVVVVVVTAVGGGGSVDIKRRLDGLQFRGRERTDVQRRRQYINTYVYYNTSPYGDNPKRVFFSVLPLCPVRHR